MGTWGAGIFDNDLSVDVRGIYLAALRDDPSATAAVVLDRFAEEAVAPETAPDVWLALAAALWEVGRPEPAVLERAIGLIDAGADGERLRALDADDAFLAERVQALGDLRAQLLSPPPAPSIPAKAPAIYSGPPTTWNVGEVLAYALPSGRVVPMLVAQRTRTFVSPAPVLLFVAKAFDEAPTLEQFAAMKFVSTAGHDHPSLLHRWAALVPEDERPDPYFGEPEGATGCLSALWLTYDSDADVAHERERVRLIAPAAWRIPVLASVHRLGWTGLDDLLSSGFGLD